MTAINRKILSLAIPSILANITVPLVGMVDIAVAGHLDASSSGTASSAALIGGVAIGSMLFDLLYWNFGFLRIGTGGLTAQACGRGDMKECAGVFIRAAGIALACALVLVGLQRLFLEAAFLVVDCTPEVRALAVEYFSIRIWAAPATLCLMAFKGWFIGMQDGVSPMITDLVVNVMNAIVSIALALGFTAGRLHYDGMGFAGIAAGTVVAQYIGLLSAVLIMLARYRKRVFSGFRPASVYSSFKGGETRRFFSMNADLFIRSAGIIGIYIGFTMLSSRQGDLVLAGSAILMKIMMLFSYFTDGFAYAGEALCGRFIGEKDGTGLRQTVRMVFAWSMGIAVMFMLLYAVAGTPVLRMMTSDPDVISMCMDYMPWLLVMPLAGCAAFTWDGIYVGATASVSIRNAMVLALAGFFAVYLAGAGLLGVQAVQDWLADAGRSSSHGLSPEVSWRGHAVLHILLAAYLIHLVVRTVYLSMRYRKDVLSRVPGL